MNETIRERQSGIKLVMGVVGLTMVASSVFKNEIEPVRVAAREAVVNVFSIDAKTAQAALTTPEAK